MYKRQGKHITLEVEAENEETASVKVKQACEKILCNQIMEYFDYSIKKL